MQVFLPIAAREIRLTAGVSAFEKSIVGADDIRPYTVWIVNGAASDPIWSDGDIGPSFCMGTGAAGRVVPPYKVYINNFVQVL